MCGVHLHLFQNAQKEKENDENESSELSTHALMCFNCRIAFTRNGVKREAWFS